MYIHIIRSLFCMVLSAARAETVYTFIAGYVQRDNGCYTYNEQNYGEKYVNDAEYFGKGAFRVHHPCDYHQNHCGNEEKSAENGYLSKKYGNCYQHKSDRDDTEDIGCAAVFLLSCTVILYREVRDILYGIIVENDLFAVP